MLQNTAQLRSYVSDGTIKNFQSQRMENKSGKQTLICLHSKQDILSRTNTEQMCQFSSFPIG